MLQVIRFKRIFMTVPGIVLLQVLLFSGLAVIAPADADESQPRSDNQGAPRIEVDREYVDYGEVPLEQMVKHRTVIKNVGDAPLVIEDCHAGIIHSKAIEGC